jgi:Tfp pilus assembly protein PilV
VISSLQGLSLYTNTEKRTHTQTQNIHALNGVPTNDPGFRASEDVHALDRSATVTGLKRFNKLKNDYVCMKFNHEDVMKKSHASVLLFVSAW